MKIGTSFNKSRLKIRILFIVILGVVTFFFSTGFIWLTTDLQTFVSVKKEYRPSDVWIVDHQGYPLESIRTQNEKRSLEWVQWSEVSPAFRNLLVAVEDRRFYSHPGVDFLAISIALWERISGRSYRGASTIPMQLINLLKARTPYHLRTLKQKFIQIIVALKLNSKWTKEEILEAYINKISFRGELIGLRAASLGYFGKNPSGLVQEEAALLISLLRSPNSSPALVAKRACRTLAATDCRSLENLAQQVFSQPYRLPRTRELVPVLSHLFVEDGLNTSLIHTSLDHQVQKLALDSLKEQLLALRPQNVNDGAVLILETQTGRIIAYAANAGAGVASAEQIDGVQSRRQAGSTIKPFVYATAFQWEVLKPESLIEDSPADISISQGQVYHPKNYDTIFRGLVSAGEALGSSMNVPAVRALKLIGEPKVLDNLRKLGFQQLQDDEYYGPSLALGAIDVTLWELTQGYRQFAIKKSTFSDKTRAAIFNILGSSEYRRFTFGMDSILTLPFSAAVKTGTSKDMRDNWCIGWTPQYTVGVWIGNFNGEPMWNVSGMTGAAPIWRRLMLALHPHPTTSTATKYEPPTKPLQRRTISRIRYPAANMLVGFDPDIPTVIQKLPIEIENPQHGHKLYLNNRFLSKAQETTLWPVQRGQYRIELKSSNQLIDSLNFEVR